MESNPEFMHPNGVRGLSQETGGHVHPAPEVPAVKTATACRVRLGHLHQRQRPTWGERPSPKCPHQVTPQLLRMAAVVQGEMTREAIQKAIGIKYREDFRKRYLHPAPSAGVLEMIIPDKPSSRLQKYRLTEKGHRLPQPNNQILTWLGLKIFS